MILQFISVCFFCSFARLHCAPTALVRSLCLASCCCSAAMDLKLCQANQNFNLNFSIALDLEQLVFDLNWRFSLFLSRTVDHCHWRCCFFVLFRSCRPYDLSYFFLDAKQFFFQILFGGNFMKRNDFELISTCSLTVAIGLVSRISACHDKVYRYRGYHFKWNLLSLKLNQIIHDVNKKFV